jgi:formate-dependent phosphoribosylglycinamide formyltransferase (GAR transformylase)
VPFLAEHFRRSAFIQMRNYEAAFFKAVVEKEQPDIVIDECGERVLYYLETGPRYRPED